MNSPLTLAQLCRKRGWKRGTIAICNSGIIKDAYRITAIGDTRVLVKRIAVLTYDGIWTKCTDGEEIWQRLSDNPQKVDRAAAAKIRLLYK